MKQRKSEVYSREFKNKIGRYLLKAPRGSLKRAAEMLEVTPRTLNEWKRSVVRDDQAKALGRPRKVASIFEQLKIAREWKRQGYPGARSICIALPGTSVRHIRQTIALLKKRHRRKTSTAIARRRVSISVPRPGRLLTIDATLTQKGQEVLVARDRASLQTYVHPCRKRAKTFDTLVFLKKLENAKRLPLVLASDNGGAFTSEAVREYCRSRKVVLLRSMPRTPQHNGACEIAVREVKDILARGLEIDETCLALNEGRKRRRLGYQTANQFDRKHFLPYTEEDRAELFAAVSSAVERSQLGIERAREKRMLEREAILKTLESFKLIKVTRGDQLARSEPEDIR